MSHLLDYHIEVHSAYKDVLKNPKEFTLGKSTNMMGVMGGVMGDGWSLAAQSCRL